MNELNDSKMFREVAHRMIGSLSRWAVPIMLICISTLLKIGYDGFLNEFTKLRNEMSSAVSTINETRRGDIAGIEARQNEQAAQNRQVRDEQMARTARIANLEATVARNTAWIERADITMQTLSKEATATATEVRLIRQILSPGPARKPGDGLESHR